MAMWNNIVRGSAGLCAVLFCAAASLADELPAPAGHEIDFHREVLPILANRCVTCHASGRAEGSFSLETRSDILRESDSGQTVVPGDSASSMLIDLVAGTDPTWVMPKQGKRLSDQEVGILRAWIDQGVAWDKDISLRKLTMRSWKPKQVDLPAAREGWEHPVDRLMISYFAEYEIDADNLVDDATFARRVYYDVTGLPPTVEQLASFQADTDPDKRAKLVRTLLDDNEAYAQHWLSFWNDLLRNDYAGTGFIDGGRKQITGWLYKSLHDNQPLDKMVSDLIQAAPGAEGFVHGIVWRGAVNASQRPPLQAAQNLSQVFLGVNLKCASCHDSFVSQWKLEDAYALAGVFSDKPLEMFECDKTLGRFAEAQFLNTELGTVSNDSDQTTRRREVAQLMTSPDNARLRRTIVNRFWGRFLGRGVIEPIDEFDNPAWHEDLLDYLAADLQAHDDNLKHAMERILTSRAYQLPSVDTELDDTKVYVFQGPQTRRLTAEQFLDSVWMYTGTGPAKADAPLPNVGGPSGSGGTLPGQWIWSYAAGSDAKPAAGEQITVRRTFKVDPLPEKAWAAITCDNQYTLWLNGQKLGTGDDWGKPGRYDLRPHLKAGENELVIVAKNLGSDPNPAAVYFAAKLQTGDQLETIATDDQWQWTNATPDDSGKVSKDAAWYQAEAVRNQGFLGADIQGKLLAALEPQSESKSFVRASLVNNNPLMTTLGRPNREQVVTTRPADFATLQALDLTNGPELNQLLTRGAENLLTQHPDRDASAWAETLYQKFLGRGPSEAEQQIALEILGDKPNVQGVADLLWCLVMLPEFQLIR